MGKKTKTPERITPQEPRQNKRKNESEEDETHPGKNENAKK